MPKKQPEHILVIRLSAMGDVAMTVPVLRALVQQHPEVKVTVLSRPFFAPFFRSLSKVEVYPVDLKGKHKGVLGLFKLSKELRKLKVDAVADLHNVLRSNILKLFLTGKPCIQIKKGRKEKNDLITGKFFKPLKTTHQRYADVFGKLGLKIDLSTPNFPDNVKLNGKLESLLGNLSKKKIGIAPFAAHESKMYPLDLMEEVIANLSKEYHIVLFGGGKNEIKVLNSIEKRFDNVVNAAGNLSLNEELDLISNLDVMLSMDSGNGHIAAMLGVKTVTIWGVTHPYAGFVPFNQPEDYALLSDRKKFPEIPTSVYGNKFPESYKEATRSISPKDVIKKIKNLV